MKTLKYAYENLGKSTHTIYKLKSTLCIHIQIHNLIQQTHYYNFKLDTHIDK